MTVAELTTHLRRLGAVATIPLGDHAVLTFVRHNPHGPYRAYVVEVGAKTYAAIPAECHAVVNTRDDVAAVFRRKDDEGAE